MYALYTAYETITYPAGEVISTHTRPSGAYRALRRSHEPKRYLAVGQCFYGEKKGDTFGKEPRHEN